MKVIRCAECGKSPDMSQLVLGDPMPPLGRMQVHASCPSCKTFALEWRWESAEWRTRLEAARSRLRLAEGKVIEAERDLAELLHESISRASEP